MTAHQGFKAAAISLVVALVLVLTACTGGISSNVDYEDAKCTISDLTIDASGLIPVVKANVRNKADETESLYALIELYDSDGNKIGSSALMANDIPAGEEAPFDAAPMLIDDKLVTSENESEAEKITRMEISGVYTGAELSEYQDSKNSRTNASNPLIGYWNFVGASINNETYNLSGTDEAYAIFSADKTYVIVVGDETYSEVWAEYDSEDVPYVFSFGNDALGGDIVEEDGKTTLFMVSQSGNKLLFKR